MMKLSIIRSFLYSIPRASTSRISVVPSTCWNCKSNTETNIFCPSCNLIQPLKADANFFDYFNLKRDFNIDQKSLKDKFRQIQTQVHPDKYGLSTDNEKKLADIHSSFANQAFKTLTDKKSRAIYILELTHTDEGVTDPGFAMEMLEMNEEIEESNDNVFLENKLREIQKEIDKFMDSIATNFEAGKNEDARDALNKMRYFERTKKLIMKKLNLPI